MSIKTCFTVWFSVWLLLVSCTPAPISQTQSPTIQTSNIQPTLPTVDSYRAEQARQDQQRLAQIKQKKPYHGTIGIQIDPQLMGQKNKFQVLNLTEKLKTNTDDFQIQSVPNGPIQFQETFTKSRSIFEVTRTIRIADTSQRYTLHVQKNGTPNSDGEVAVNINGTNWIKAQDFKHSQEVERNSLLLNASNSLRVRLQGKTGVSATITLVKGGDAGTILRRRGQLGRPGETQATHEKSNDTNIFDPNDVESLGGLEPYSGEQISADNRHATAIQVNGTDKLAFESGRLILEFNDAQYMSAFQAEYGATVVEQRENRYLMQLDLNRSPIYNIANLLRMYNHGIAINIEQISFGSLAGMQTFAILLDSLIHHPDWLKGIEVNSLISTQQAVPTPTPMPVATPICESPPPDAQDWEFYDCQKGKSWWLLDTKVPEAWEYSIGTGARVAYIDRGFMGNKAKANPEINRRIKIGDEYQNNIGINELSEGPYTNHGLRAILTGFAEKDNQIKTAGVAPNAEVYPYHAPWGLWELETAFDHARKSNPSVIGSSLSGTPDPIYAQFYSCLNPFLCPLSYHWSGSGLSNKITEIVESGIPVVISAGNGGRDAEGLGDSYLNYIPQNHPLVIAVGAVDPASRIADPKTGLPNVNSKGLHVKNSSKYGPNLIWAPGENMYVSANNPTPLSSNTLDYFNGTSAAAPFVTGVVALIKSRNHGLSPLKIKQILKEASNAGLTVSPAKDNPATGSVKMINVEAAIKHSSVWSLPQKPQFPVLALVVQNGSVKSIKFNQSLVNGALPEYQEQQIPQQTVSQFTWDNNFSAGKVIQVRGWNNINAGPFKTFGITEMEVLEATPLCDASSCTNVPNSLKPTVNEIGVFPTLANNGSIDPSHFAVNFQGKNLMFDLRAGVPSVLEVLFKNTVTGKVTPVPIPAENTLNLDNGTIATVKIPRAKVSSGTYQIAWKGLTGQTSFLPTEVSIGGLGSAPKPPGGFSILGVSATDNNYISNGTQTTLPPGGMGWTALDGNLNNTQVTVGNVPASTIEIQQQVVGFKVPQLAPTGVQDVVISTDDGSITLNQAVNIQDPSPILNSLSTVKIEQDADLTLLGNHFNSSAVVKIGSTTLTPSTLETDRIVVRIPETLAPSSYLLKVCQTSNGIESCSGALTIQVLPIPLRVDLVSVDNPILFSNGSQTADYHLRLRGIPQGQSLGLSFKLKSKGGALQGNLYCDSCGFYVASTSSVNKTATAGTDFTIRYRVPNTNIWPDDYQGTLDKPWQDSRHMDELEVRYLGNLIGPVAPADQPDLAKVYWVWTDKGNILAPTEVIANGQSVSIYVNDVRDKAGRIVPDGTSVWLTNVYWGYWSYPYGTGSDNGPTVLLVSGGAGTATYNTRQQPAGWAYPDGVQDCFYGIGLRTTTTDNNKKLDGQTHCIKTYNLP